MVDIHEISTNKTSLEHYSESAKIFVIMILNTMMKS